MGPGREPINLPGGQLAGVRYTPIVTELLRCHEMTRCAILGLNRLRLLDDGGRACNQPGGYLNSQILSRLEIDNKFKSIRWRVRYVARRVLFGRDRGFGSPSRRRQNCGTAESCKREQGEGRDGTPTHNRLLDVALFLLAPVSASIST